MSIHDDATNFTGVLAYGEFWYAPEPNAVQYTRILNPRNAFVLCQKCGVYTTALDIVTGDFGNIHCVYCGSDDISY